MLIPRYYFAGEYKGLYEYFLAQPHEEKSFGKNEYLWSPGEPLTHIHYIKSGIIQTSVEHENGFQKIVSFHSVGTVFPGCHRLDFKIEQSILSKTLSVTETLCFSREDFYDMLQSNRELNAAMIDWYAMYVNLLIYENAHQEYNNSFLKLCNLLYLFSQNAPFGDPNRIELTQENIADILTISRINAARNLSKLRDEQIIIPHRKWIEIINPQALASYCSQETIRP